MALTYVIACDISDDNRRAHAAAILQAHGDRIQRSVFICTPEAGILHELCDRLSQIINPRTGSLHVFRQCSSCWDAITVYGQATVTGQPLYRAVL
jgi:CRISPR-associated protein Cas2